MCVSWVFLPRLSGFGNGFVQGGFCQLWLCFFSSSRLSGFGNRPQNNCVLVGFSSLCFPDLETGFVQGGVCQLGTVVILFSSSRLSGFGNRVVQGGSANVSSLGFLDLETGFMQGGVCRYTQGGCRSTKLRHRHCPKSTVSSIIYWFLRLSGFGNRVLYLLYAGGVDAVNFVIDIYFKTFVNGLPDLETGW